MIEYALLQGVKMLNAISCALDDHQPISIYLYIKRREGRVFLKISFDPLVPGVH